MSSSTTAPVAYFTFAGFRVKFYIPELGVIMSTLDDLKAAMDAHEAEAAASQAAIEAAVADVANAVAALRSSGGLSAADQATLDDVTARLQAATAGEQDAATQEAAELEADVAPPAPAEPAP